LSTPSLTLLAIDGTGKLTKPYLDLLEALARMVRVREARFLSADLGARSPGIDCVRVDTMDYRAYGRFCVEQLANHVSTSHCLCVQLDGFVVNPALWDDEFLRFDYIGAPWRSRPDRPFPAPAWVGNGGFSLRSRRFLERTASLRWSDDDWRGARLPPRHVGNEDYFLCVLQRAALEDAGMRFAPVDLAARFSLQSGDALGAWHSLRTVFGFHGKGLVASARRQLERQGHGVPRPQRRWFGLLGG
jgi:hypothetical protein